jgi:hypothetical protein
VPALIDLFEISRLASIWIGVEGEGGNHPQVDTTLLARADYRIRLAHYPTIPELMKWTLFQQEPKLKEPLSHLGSLPEQAVSLVIDNVTGKHYDRTPKWLWVERQRLEDEPKTLHCGEATEFDCIAAECRARMESCADSEEQGNGPGP